MTALTLDVGVRTHMGLVRTNNEDSLLASPRLVAVADGVGGSAAGEVASRTAIDALKSFMTERPGEPSPDGLRAAIHHGNESIAFIAEARPGLRGMGTTLTAVALGEEYVIAHIGDSRSYLLRDSALSRLTRDDSYVQFLVDRGVLDEAAARSHPQRSVVLQALDGEPGRDPSIVTVPAREGDRLLVCSDGLTDLVDDDTLVEALAIESPQEAADALVDRALAAGGKDNVSVIVADVVAADDDGAAG